VAKLARTPTALPAAMSHSPASMIFHVARGCLGAEKASLEIGVDNEIPFGFGHIEKRLPCLSPGIVHKNVEAAKLANHAIDHGGDCRRNADVSLHLNRLAPKLPNLVHRFQRFLRFRDVVHRDPAASSRELERNALPDPAARPGHQCRASLQRLSHC